MVELRDIVIINTCCYYVPLKTGATAVLVVYILYNLAMLGVTFAADASHEKFLFINLSSLLIISFLVEQSLKIVYTLLSVILVAVNILGIYAVINSDRKFLLPAVAVNGFLLAYDLFAVIIFAITSFHLPYALLIAIYVSKNPCYNFISYIVIYMEKGSVKYWIDEWSGVVSDVSEYIPKAIFLPGYFLANIILLALFFHLFTVIYSYYLVLEEEDDYY